MGKTYSVYRHTTPSGKVYIGITSQEVERRWKNGEGYLHNEHFTRAIQKYGWDGIRHEIITSGLTKEEATEAEKLYIALYRSYERKYGYNMTMGGETGAVFTDEVRRKISKSKKGHHYNVGVPFTEERKRHLSENHADVSGEKNPMYGKKLTPEQIARRQAHRTYARGADHPRAKSILQLDMDGNLVKRWGSITEAGKWYSKSSIKECLYGNQRQHRGYLWRYEHETRP